MDVWSIPAKGCSTSKQLSRRWWRVGSRLRTRLHYPGPHVMANPRLPSSLHGSVIPLRKGVPGEELSADVEGVLEQR